MVTYLMLDEISTISDWVGWVMIDKPILASQGHGTVGGLSN